MNDGHYICRPGGEPEGPMPTTEVHSRVASGALGEGDFVCREGDTEWTLIGAWLQQQAPPLPVSAEVMTDTRNANIDLPAVGQERPALKAARQKVMELLTPDEKIMAVAAQTFTLLSPDAVVLTTRRIIVFRPSLGGLVMNFFDCRWIDVLDVHIEENLLGCNLTIKSVGGVSMLDRLDKKEAKAVYRIAQQLEDASRQGRRDHHLEELRAGSAVLRGGSSK